MKIKIKRLHPAAIIPQYATDGAACFDLHSVPGGGPLDVLPGEWIKFRTGLSFEIPDGHVMLVFSRSGHGFKNDVRLSNCVGVIDSDYRGEVIVKLVNDQSLSPHDDDTTFLRVNPGDRIAQAMVVPYPRVEFVESDELSDTARGAGGFGSTGQ